jgi:N-acetyl-gamma-glutamyl-phosphate reductase
MPAALGPNTKTPSVFIDGEAGTTGLQIRERLARLDTVAVRSIAPDQRKQPKARQALMREVDVVILCLPDDAAKEAVALADDLGGAAPRIIDASTAHRVDPAWVYGFPELTAGHAEKVAAAARVSNPGCYPTGSIALLRPLVEAGLLPPDHPITINAVSGYSGGGKSMIEAYDAGTAPNFELYGLGFAHKHLPEMQTYALLNRRPIFVPSVGNYRQGMLVSVPLNLDLLPGRPGPQDLRVALAKHYAGSRYVRVITDPATDAASKSTRLEAESLNETNLMELRVFGSEAHRQAVLVAKLDNLGKGASGAAVQCLGLMLNVDVVGAEARAA